MRKEGEPPEGASATDTSGAASLDDEVVNQAKALWTLPRTEITDG